MPRFRPTKNRSHFISFIEPFPWAKSPTQNHAHLPSLPHPPLYIIKMFQLCSTTTTFASTCPLPDSPWCRNPVYLITTTCYRGLHDRPFLFPGGVRTAASLQHISFITAWLLLKTVVNSVLTGKWKFPSSSPPISLNWKKRVYDDNENY